MKQHTDITRQPDLAASLVCYFFNQLSRYPRQSRKEDKIRAFIIRWAGSHSYHLTVDGCGNCIITVPPSNGREDSAPLALQAHMDMVCEAAPGHTHDFSKDPIVPRYDGDWIRAHNTTLGADNGIGVALAMALCEDPLIEHPQLELLFTVDEETGLTGAAGLSREALSAQHLLNLDSEDDAVLITGCAGGVNIELRRECAIESRKRILSRMPNAVARTLHLTGFHGGHSGVDINEPLGNALCCGAAVVQALISGLPDGCYVGAMNSGTVHNAIPRDFWAHLLFADADTCARAERIIAEQLRRYAADHKLADTLTFELVNKEERFNVRVPADSAAIMAFLTQLPHGVKSFTDNPAIPQTSSNAALITADHKCDSILLSVRGSHRQEMLQFIDEISALASTHNVAFSRSGEYPAWQPQQKSRLLDKCKQAYEKTRGHPPRVEVIHAGLEPAVISKIFPNLDMVSCGPLILNPHSPQERVSISSIAHVYRMLIQLLRDW